MGGLFVLFPTQVGATTNNKAASHYNNCANLIKAIYPEIVSVNALKFTKQQPITGAIVKFKGIKTPQHYAIVMAVDDNKIILQEWNWPYGHETIGRQIPVNDKSIVGFYIPHNE